MTPRLRRRLGLAALLLFAAASVAGAILIAALGATNLGESIAGVAAVDALVGAAVAVLQNRSMRRQDTAEQYVVRANQHEMIPFNARVSAFLRLDLPLEALDVEKWKERTPAQRAAAVKSWVAQPPHARRAQKLEYWRGMSQLEKGEVVLYPNLFEELGVMHRLGRLDEDIVATQFESAVQTYYTHARWFVESLRRSSGWPAYTEWEYLVRRLSGGIWLDNDSRESLGFIESAAALLDAVCAHLPDSTLFLEGVEDELIARNLTPAQPASPRKVHRGGAQSGADFHLAARSNLAGVVSRRAHVLEDELEQRCCEHLVAYRGRHVLLEAFEAGDGWVDVNKDRVDPYTREQLWEQLGSVTGPSS